MGELWQDGEPVALASLNELSAKVDFAPRKCNVIRAGDKLSAGDYGKPGNYYYIPPFGYQLDQNARKTYCVVYPLANGAGEIVIPCVEVARAWYLRSTVLVHGILDTDPDMWLGRFANPERTYHEVDGSYRLGLRKDVPDADATVIAMLLLDQRGSYEARRIYETMVRARQTGHDAAICCRPPLVGVHSIRAHGVWMNSGGVWRFLLHFFSHVPFPELPPINVERDNHNPIDTDSAIEGNSDLPVAWPGKRKRTRSHHLEETVSANAEPDLGMPLRHAGAALPEIENPPSITRAPPRNQVSRSVSVPGQVDPPPHHSTAPGAYSEGAPTPFRLVDDCSSSSANRPPRLPSDFRSFGRALSYLESFGVRFDLLSIDADPIRSDGLTISEVDVSDPRNNKRAARSGGQPRQYVLAELSKDGLVAYCWEFEPRQSSSHSATKSGPPTAVIRTHDGSRMTQGQIEDCVSAFVRGNGVWPHLIGENIQVARIVHRHADAQAFAKKIVRKFEELCVEPKATEVNESHPEESGLAAAH
ncbi:hypothetical protein [Algiphilus sp.]|uniref:hypothetical protein n=1 Tax=Algiphilus sp. TaxID=1872431 RepID=UPI0032EFED25